MTNQKTFIMETIPSTKEVKYRSIDTNSFYIISPDYELAVKNGAEYLIFIEPKYDVLECTAFRVKDRKHYTCTVDISYSWEQVTNILNAWLNLSDYTYIRKRG